MSTLDELNSRPPFIELYIVEFIGPGEFHITRHVPDAIVVTKTAMNTDPQHLDTKYWHACARYYTELTGVLHGVIAKRKLPAEWDFIPEPKVV